MNKYFKIQRPWNKHFHQNDSIQLFDQLTVRQQMTEIELKTK